MGRLYAIADLHLSWDLNRQELAKLDYCPDDSLILAGDLGEKAEHLELAFEVATKRFKTVYWVPGNHELYSVASGDDNNPTPRGVKKYEECVEVARRYGVLTPEDEFAVHDGGEGGPVLICLLFTLYDYTFAPPPHDESPEKALAWAEEVGTVATDEVLLHADPYDHKVEWGLARQAISRQRLEEAKKKHPDLPLVLVNHWPLRRDLIYIPLAPRFEIWCGSVQTEAWHREFGAKVVVTGHLHVPRTDWRDGCRFEEVSLGYPRQWQGPRDRGLDINMLMREIWPGEVERKGNVPPEDSTMPKWRRNG
uniref:Calcineurin-like phosphoesterase domain-containing protein n=1 Tax=Bionectria ochroleuca TaxID=29856 RepID=A0A8H7TUE9_BIOOC